MKLQSIAPAVMGLCLSLLAGGEAKAATFTFTKIADTSSTFSNFFNSPSINDAGTVAFTAGLDTGGVGVFTGNGESTTTIALNQGDSSNIPSYLSLLTAATINNAGTVVFGVNSSTSQGVFTGDGESSKSLTTISTLAPVADPVINNLGTVVFAAFVPQSNVTGPSLITDDGGSFTTVVPTTGVLTGTAIDDAGTVAFSSGPSYLYGEVGTVSSGGGPIKLISGGGCSSVSINQLGALALSCSGPQGVSLIFTVSSSPFVPSTFIASAKFLYGTPFTIVNNPSINDAGTVAFLAQLSGGRGEGIFTGQDPVADKLIASGDSLLGSTVADITSPDYALGLNINFSPRGLNNRGQFAFSAKLADGTSGIFRADPVTVPESSFSILGMLSFAISGVTLLERKQKRQSSTT